MIELYADHDDDGNDDGEWRDAHAVRRSPAATLAAARMSSSPPSHGSLSSRVLHLYDYRWLILGHMHDDGNVNYVMYVIPQAAADRPQQENAPSCARRRPGWAGRDRQLRRQLPVRRRDVVLRDVPFVSSRFSLASRSPFARRSVLPAATSREMVNDPELMDLSLEVALLVVCGRAVDVQSVQLLLFGLIELLQVPRLEQPRQHPLAERDEQRDGNRKEDPRESRPRETCRFVDGIFRQSVGKWRWWHGRPGLALDRDSPSTGPSLIARTPPSGEEHGQQGQQKR